jgi:hypothetical protein
MLLSVSYATSATLGVLMLILALGYRDLALALALGHAAFRMIQILRSGTVLADAAASGSGSAQRPKLVAEWRFRLAWRLRRLDADFTAIGLLKVLFGRLRLPRGIPTATDAATATATATGANTATSIAIATATATVRRWLVVAAGVVLAGFPFTPIAHALDDALAALLVTHPAVAVAAMAVHFAFSVFVMRFLLLSVFVPHRVRNKLGKWVRRTVAKK